ncbi:MAG: CHRD domain-containing protein [Acidimicrobiia bacterium]
MRARRIVALAGLFVLIGVLPAQAETASFTATLSPAEEVPTKGPEGASGTAKVDINTDTNQVCYELSPSGLTESPTAGHIHQGAKGASGPVFIDFAIATNGLKNCVTSDATKVAAVTGDPAGYYVNIHTASFAAGAMRGQLVAAAGSGTGSGSTSGGSSLASTGAPLSAFLAALGLACTVLGATARIAGRRRRSSIARASRGTGPAPVGAGR